MRFRAPFELSVSLVLALGCGSTETTNPPGPPDCTGPDCVPRPPGGGTGVGGGSTDAAPGLDALADGGRVNVTFSVRQTIDTWFWSAVPYTGVVQVAAAGPTGRLVGSGDAGVEPSGVVEGVDAGLNWFAVREGGSTGRIAPTLQPVVVDPSRPTIELRAIASDALMTLIVDQVLWTPPSGTATLVLNFRRGGRPLPGVTISRDTLPSGTSIAYDASGGYQSDAMILGSVPATGVEGTAIVRQVAGAQTFPGLISLTLPYRLGTSDLPPIEAKLARDFVTWMVVEIP
jgi:hypothetical protein